MRLTLTPSRNLPSWTPHSSTIPQIVLFAARALKYGIVANAPSITARTISNVPILWISALTIVPTPRTRVLVATPSGHFHREYRAKRPTVFKDTSGERPKDAHRTSR